MRSAIRPVLILLAALTVVAFPDAAAAEETESKGFATTVSLGFSFESYDPLSGSGRWRTEESGTLGCTARHGNEFSLAAEMEVPYTGEPLSADGVVDELAASWAPSPFVMLTAGKQNLKWGTARAFSSIDRLAPPLDPLDPDKTRRGVTGLRADVIPTWWLSVSAVAIPPSTDGGYLDETTYALRAEILAGETDLSFGAIRSVADDGDEEPAFFADFARFFDRFGIYGEAQVVLNEETETSVTGGLQIDVPAWLNGTITCLGEYRYAPEEDDATHQLYAGLSGIPLSRRVSAGCSLLAAPEARQAIFGAAIDGKINQSAVARLEWNYLHDWEAKGSALTPLYTANRQSLGASISLRY